MGTFTLSEYTPDSAAQVPSSPSRWAKCKMPNYTWLDTNIWNPYDAYGSRKYNGWPMPMQMWTRVFDNQKRHWHVTYDVLGQMGAGNPYLDNISGHNYSFIKAYPHIQYEPVNLQARDSGTMNFQSVWNLGAKSTRWDLNQFNAIWEIRLAKRGSNGAYISGSWYIIQIEVLQARYGDPSKRANWTRNDPRPVTLSGYQWYAGNDFTDGYNDVYKFTLKGAGVSSDFSRTVSLNLFDFINYTTANASRYGYTRASSDAYVRELNAGVEIGVGTSSTVTTYSYWGSAWKK